MLNKGKITKVLLVEDDNYLNRIIRNHMESEGYEVDSSLSYKDAMKIVKKQNGKYDVLIVDYKLSNSNGKNGMDVFEKTKEANPDIKTIMISAYGSYAVKRDAFKKGINKFLDKPFFLEDLTFTVSH
jgi:DNA-binding NtrC family response regulator